MTPNYIIALCCAGAVTILLFLSMTGNRVICLLCALAVISLDVSMSTGLPSWGELSEECKGGFVFFQFGIFLMLLVPAGGYFAGWKQRRSIALGNVKTA